MEIDVNNLRNEVNRIHSKQIDTLKQLCMIDSGSKNIEGINKVADMIISLFENENVKIEKIDDKNGPVLIIRFNEGAGNKVIINAHMDTVFKEGDCNRFPVHEDGDYLYGLGSSDCKGGIVVSAYTMLLARKLGLLQNREYTLIYACDEEIGSETSDLVYRRECENASCALVFEPSRGNKGIITSRRSSCNATIEVFGKKAHSSEYEKGANAVIGLSNIIQKLNKHHDPENNIYINIGEIKTDSPINQVCDHASMKISCRVTSKETADKFFAIFDSCLDPEENGCTSKITKMTFRNPMERTDKNIELYKVAKKAGELMGLNLEEIHSFGSSDASKFSAYDVATIDALGSYTYGMHVNDEHTSKDSIKERTLLALLIINLLK